MIQLIFQYKKGEKAKIMAYKTMTQKTLKLMKYKGKTRQLGVFTIQNNKNYMTGTETILPHLVFRDYLPSKNPAATENRSREYSTQSKTGK